MVVAQERSTVLSSKSRSVFASFYSIYDKVHVFYRRHHSCVSNKVLEVVVCENKVPICVW